MKKHNPTLGMAKTKTEADELIKKLGKGHAVRSGGWWRVYQYAPGDIGRDSLYHNGINRSKPSTPKEGA